MELNFAELLERTKNISNLAEDKKVAALQSVLVDLLTIAVDVENQQVESAAA